MMAQMAKLYGKWPHEIAFGKNDAPGDEIPWSHLTIDFQATLAYMKTQEPMQE